MPVLRVDCSYCAKSTAGTACRCSCIALSPNMCSQLALLVLVGQLEMCQGLFMLLAFVCWLCAPSHDVFDNTSCVQLLSAHRVCDFGSLPLQISHVLVHLENPCQRSLQVTTGQNMTLLWPHPHQTDTTIQSADVSATLSPPPTNSCNQSIEQDKTHNIYTSQLSCQHMLASP